MNEQKLRKINKWAKVALRVIPIITIIAIVLVVRWALSSPTLETLVTVSIGIGVATIGGLFQAFVLIYNATNSVKEDLRESTSSIRGDLNSVRVEIRTNTDRIVEAIERAKA